MEELTLKVETRELKGKKNKELRRNNKIPGVVYGHGFSNKNIAVNYNDFKEVFERAGESSLINLVIDNEAPIKVIIQDVQFDPVSDKFIHVDFHKVKMTEKITTEIELKFVGEALAVKELGGVLVRALEKVEVECLPGDLVSEIEVDLSPLKTFDDIIYVKDLKVPEKITLLEKSDEVVAKVQAPRTEEELKALEEEVEEKVEEVEGVSEKEEEKKEIKEEEKISKEEKNKEEKEEKANEG